METEGKEGVSQDIMIWCLSLIKTAWIIIVIAIAIDSRSPAASRSTLLGDIASGVADRLNEYAEDHNGIAPAKWEDLDAYWDLERLERNVGGPIASKMLLLAGVYPSLTGPQPGPLVAVTAFPIDEDRRGAVGRYVVYRRADNGRFSTRWETEVVIQSAFATANIAPPSAAVFHEVPLLQFDQAYGFKLIQDGLRHGVPLEQVVGTVEKHIQQVSKGESKQASSWADLSASSNHIGTTPAQAIDVQNVGNRPLPGKPNATTRIRSWKNNTLFVIGGIAAALVISCSTLFMLCKGRRR